MTFRRFSLNLTYIVNQMAKIMNSIADPIHAIYMFFCSQNVGDPQSQGQSKKVFDSTPSYHFRPISTTRLRCLSLFEYLYLSAAVLVGATLPLVDVGVDTLVPEPK